MLSRFFLDRPVFAWVIAIVIMAAGLLGIYNLPVSQYPPIAPPSIAITAFYPGASAETVENSVTQIIEQKMTGFDRLLYMSATSDSAGSSRLELTFAPGTDPDLAWAQVQNKLQLALPSLPETVKNQGVQVSKSTRNYLMIVSLISEDGSMDGNDLRDFAQSNLEKVLARVPGVGEVQIFGSQYAMRIWLDPDKLTEYNLTVEDVIASLKTYNVEVSAGQFGGAPAVKGQRLNASIVVQNMLKTPEEFAAVPIRINADGSTLRIRDVGRTELGTEAYDIQAFYNGKPAAGLAIRQAAGANALDTADAVKAKMAEMSRFFPPGLKVVYPHDTTPFIRVAIKEVVKTLLEAVILVFLVMWLFLGTVRATLIPTIAVPVVILGTFAMLSFFGYSINMLTMFAMVLAIGLLVDDAIVVVENVERIMAEEGLPPREATAKSMGQITSALVGIGLVLSAVFGPMAFFPGSTGVIYRQFSVTIICAMLLSVVVALILTPVLCASLLRPVPAGHKPADGAIPLLRPFLRWFDNTFFALRDRYLRLVAHSLGHKGRYLVVFLLLLGLMAGLFLRMPTSYLPDEDQGMLLSQVIMPQGATLEQTQKVLDQIQSHFLNNEKEAVASCLTIAGIGFSGRGQNNGMVFIKLKDWEERQRKDLKAPAIAGRAMAALSFLRSALVFTFPPPAVTELGSAKGFDFQLLDRGGLGRQALRQAQDELLGLAASDKRLAAVRPNTMVDMAEYRIDVDWEKAGALGVPINSIHRTISAALGSAYVNDFIHAGRVKRVYLQADAPHRMLPQDLDKLHVRNTAGKMVPFSSFASGRWLASSPQLARYNGFPSLNIWGEAAPGRSSGEAMQAMEELVGRLPKGFGFDWTGLSYQERMSSTQAPLLYAFSVFVIFLCLAALYESWPIPISILLVLPLGAIGGVIASGLRGLANDVYFQIGLLTTLGLTTKNAILIVQFAKAAVEQGMGLAAATLEGAKLRFRPIVMTSLAFGFGVLPLALTGGAGAGAQNAIGTSVLGGMVTATVLVVVFSPLFYVIIEGTLGRGRNGNPLQPKGGNKSPLALGLLLLTAALTLLAGCSLAPRYERPPAPVPSSWPEASSPEQGEAKLPPWQGFLSDPGLQKVIGLAIANNRDLRVAVLNAERARALYGIQRAELLPSVGATGSAARGRLPADLSSSGKATVTERYDVALGISAWEIDLFGRISSLKDRALEEYLATQETRRSAELLLVAATARAYLTLAADRQLRETAFQILKAQEESARLVGILHETGLASVMDLQQAISQREAARQEAARWEEIVSQDLNGLSLLCGAPLSEEQIPGSLEGIVEPPEVRAGLSSAILLRRPDVLAAEHRLKAANANIGAARAAFLPRIALTASAGTASADLAGLFQAGSGAWSFVPQITLPIFDARTWSAYEVTKAEREISLAQYEKAIQTAFREAADALASRAVIKERLAAQERLAAAAAETLRLAQERQRTGLDSQLRVLEARRSLLAASQGLLSLRLARFLNRLNLYFVLGAGG